MEKAIPQSEDAGKDYCVHLADSTSDSADRSGNRLLLELSKYDE